MSPKPSIVRINTHELEQADEDPVDYLSYLISNVMYQNESINPEDSILESYRYTGTVPLSIHFPVDKQSTLYNSGIELDTIGEILVKRDSFQKTYTWDDLELKIELDGSRCKFVLKPAEN